MAGYNQFGGGNYNPYASTNNPQLNLQQLMQNIQQLQQLPQMQQPQMQMQQVQQNQNIQDGGTWKYAKSYQDVVGYPVAVDGTTTMFINLDDMVLWAKKIVDGKPSVQTLSLAYINDVSTETMKNSNNNNIVVEPNDSEIMEAMNNRIEKMEEKFDKLFEMLNAKPKESKSNGNNGNNK